MKGYKRTKAKSDDPSVVYKRLVKQPIIKINEIVEEESVVCIEGKIFFLETRELRGGKTLVSMALTDYSGSMTSKIFLDPKDVEIIDRLKKEKDIKLKVVLGTIPLKEKWLSWPWLLMMHLMRNSAKI